VDISRLHHPRRWVVLVLTVMAAATVALLVTSTVSAKTKKAKAGQLVAFLLPENVTPRWEGSDAPVFTAALKKLVPDAQVDVVNALADPAKQQSQAEAELTKGAKVLVIAAVDSKAAAQIVTKANASGAKVIAYDRMIKSCPLDYYVSFDSVVVGKVEAKWMADNTKKGARLVIINGSPADDNAHLVNKGIHKVLNPLFKTKAKVKVAEQWVVGWDPTKAQSAMEQILTKLNNKVDGVVSANDGMAGGIIAALKAQKLAGKVMTTGQDASLEGIQNVIRGYQGVTAFKDFRLQAPAAATIAAAVLNGTTPSNITSHISNGSVSVSSVMLKVVPVSTTNIKLLVTNGWIKSQYGSLKKVCKGMPKKSICK